MKSAGDFWNKNLETVVLAVGALLAVVPLVCALASHAAVGGAGEPFLEKPDLTRGPCIREASYMRSNHMDVLAKMRDDVVRKGVRGNVDLNRCRSCHVNRARFCDRCHQVVNVRVDCFGCHYYPENGEGSGFRNGETRR